VAFVPRARAKLRKKANAWLRPGDDVLVKGSLAMGTSAVVRGIRAQGEG
jgi:UDP-N-acetylmuramyl pentapeptide synthase